MRFEPPLDAKRRALDGLATATVRKVILRFREAFWEEPSLVRERLATSSPTTAAAGGLEALAHVLGVPLRWLDVRLDGWLEHDWQSDPWTLGAHSYVTVGGGNAPQALARPLAGTLFFAGEATHADDTGTVEGAIASGRRAAARLAASL